MLKHIRPEGPGPAGEYCLVTWVWFPALIDGVNVQERRGLPVVKPVFGPHTLRVLEVLAGVSALSAAQIDLVAGAWHEASDLERAEAWARLWRADPAPEGYWVMGAASAARQAAKDAARKLGRTDWAFWAAAWDAAAAVAGDGLADRDYEILTGPLATVMPALSRVCAGAEPPGLAGRVPAQRDAKLRQAARGGGHA